ncbi:unnamed protein product, partial [Brenthis ino]
MHYLKGYLSGEAEQLLRQMPISDSNYERCWSLLNSRYNNKRYLSHFILKRLLSQRNITSESANCLKNLIDTTNDCLSSLTNLGINASTWDIIIIHILTLKLDSESRKQWEFSVTNNNSSEELPTFNQFSEFLTNRYRALEFLDTKSATVTKNSQYNNNVNKFRTFIASANKIQCAFCSEDHRIIHCNNHSAKSCQSSNKCRICNRHHHSLLHPPSSGISGANAETTKNNNGNIGSSSSESNNEMESTPLATFFSTGLVLNQVLLATALVKAASKTGEHYIIRALLDQGSQTSFVTEATVQYLGLRKFL